MNMTVKTDPAQALEEIVGQMNKAREEGNKCFKAQLFDEACRWYTECIIIGVVKLQEIEENFSLYSWSMETYEAGLYEIRKSLNLAKSNRSEVYLQQGNYESALADAEHYLEKFDTNNAKALNRKGRALEGLQQFEKAYQSFESARELNPTDMDIRKSARRTWICFRQSQEGEAYDPSDYYLNLGISNNCLDPFCEYVGPVEIQVLPGRGRGLVLTEAVIAGKVVLASKALAMASWRTDGPDLVHSLEELAARCKKCRQKLRRLQAKPYEISSEESDDPDRESVSINSGANIRARTDTEEVPKCTSPSHSGALVPIARCRDEIDVPDIVAGVDLLHVTIPPKEAKAELLSTVPDGASSSGSSDSESYRMGVPLMDLFRPCKLRDHRLSTDSEEDERAPDSGLVDKLDLEDVAQMNSFDVGHYDVLAFELRGQDHPDLSSQTMEGLWLLPSFLNHSCIPNCAAVIVGEDMILRATQNILAGEELTITYFEPFQPYKGRIRSSTNYPKDFLCTCHRCRVEESIAAPLETINRAYDKYLDRMSLDAEAASDYDDRIHVRFLSATGMTCDDFVKMLDGVMSNIRDLNEIHRTWIRASYLDAFLGQAAALPKNSKARIDSLKQLVEVSTTVQYSDVNGLIHYSKLVQEVGNYHGETSVDFVQEERNLVQILRVAYGVEKGSAALELIKKLQLMP